MPDGLLRYVDVLRQGKAFRPFAAAVVARLPISMAPLGILLLVRETQGTYWFAGAVAGAFALGTAVGGPWWGARIDRHGPSRVILLSSLLSAALLVGVALLAASGSPAALLLGAAAASGATFPPVSPAMRSTWMTALDDPGLRPAAFALDAVAVESIFVGGPLLLSGLFVLTPSVVPLLVTAALLGGGGAAYALSGSVRHEHPRRGQPAEHRLRAPFVLRRAGVPAVLGVTLAVSVGFGHIDTSMAAAARQVLHDPGRVGLLFMAIAGGSAIGGLVYGALRPSAAEHRRLPVTLAVFSLGLAPLPVLLSLTEPRLWWLMSLLFLAGLAIAPSLIISQNLMDQLTSREQLSEAQAWLATAGTTGAAAGTAAGGILIDWLGLGWSFAAASAAVLTGCGVAGLHRNRWTLHRRALEDGLA